ncbi:MAG: DUF6526 family protein [Acidobacteriota bacterium]|nr:DUF6526 family protein [Acidobacteriota bacterium]
MAEKKPQTLANHGRLVPLYHFVLSLILLVNLAWAGWRVFRDFSAETCLTFVVAFGLILLFYYCRAFPLAVQDRLIRLEERLRLTEVLPDDLRSRIGEISPDQLIGLRFAPEEELAGLVREILEGKLADRRAVKRQIQDWKPDYYRC